MVRRIDMKDVAPAVAALLEQVRGGDELIIQDSGQPVARIVPLPKAEATIQPARKPGSAKGQVWMSHDFDAPLPKELLDEFYK